MSLFFSKGEAHFRLLTVDLVVKVAHIGQAIPVQHIANPGRHVLFGFRHNRAVDIVVEKREAPFLNHLKSTLGNRLPGHLRCAEEVDRSSNKCLFVHAQVPLMLCLLQSVNQPGCQSLRRILRYSAGLRQLVGNLKVD